jgi:hypothetical protein
MDGRMRARVPSPRRGGGLWVSGARIIVSRLCSAREANEEQTTHTELSNATGVPSKCATDCVLEVSLRSGTMSGKGACATPPNVCLAKRKITE